MNSHSIKRHLKHSVNFKCAENVRSSNVVECECELRHIANLYLLVLVIGNTGEENSSIYCLIRMH